MLFYPSNTVYQLNAEEERLAMTSPTVIIIIAVDVAYIIGQNGKMISKGIYMIDNAVDEGSSGEGTFELTTAGNVGSMISWKVVPINTDAAQTGQSVIITGFQVCSGQVFGTSGFPQKQSGTGDYWIGQLMYQGQQTYQIQIKVTAGELTPVSCLVNWNAIVKAD